MATSSQKTFYFQSKLRFIISFKDDISLQVDYRFEEGRYEEPSAFFEAQFSEEMIKYTKTEQARNLKIFIKHFGSAKNILVVM